MNQTKIAIELDPFSEQDIGGAEVSPIEFALLSTNFAEFSCAEQSPTPAISAGKRATPLDVDMSFADGRQVPQGGWAKVTMRVKCPLLKFNTTQPVFTAGNEYSAKHLFMGDVSSDALKASFYVYNKKIDNRCFTFNIAFVLGDTNWQMPIFIDPKIEGGNNTPPPSPSSPTEGF